MNQMPVNMGVIKNGKMIQIPSEVSITYPPDTEGKIDLFIKSDKAYQVKFFPTCTCTHIKKDLVVNGELTVPITLKAYKGGKFDRTLKYQVYDLTPTPIMIQEKKINIKITIDG